MKKRIQVVLSDEAWAIVESVTNQANENFNVGSVGYSDVVNEMVLTSKVDIKSLQTKNTNLKRFVMSLVSKDDIDIDQVMKSLNDLKGRTGKRSAKSFEEVD